MIQLPIVNNLKLDFKNSWLNIWFNRIDNRNALSQGLIDDVILVLDSVHENRSVRGIIFRGKGGVFCSGADLKAMKNLSNAGDEKKQLAIDISTTAGELLDRINTAPQITVSVVEGAAMAGGFGLSCATDFLVTMSDSKFALTETQIGLTPAQIAPYVLRRLNFAQAKQLMLLGGQINGKKAKAIGLADYCVDDKKEMDKCLEAIRNQVLKCAPNAIAITKKIILGSQPIDRTIAADLFSDCLIGQEGQDGFNSFYEKRKPFWDLNKGENEKI